MEKTDLLKQFKAYYSARQQPHILDLDEVHYISICGKGDPSGAGFSEHVQALYASAYVLKFMCKASGRDFAVAKLEGLWDFDEKKHSRISMSDAPLKIPRSEWNYRLMIRLPDYVNQEMVKQATEIAIEKKQLAQAKHVEYFILKEGKVVQMLHTGPFSDEPETLLKMQVFIEQHKFSKNGTHHEIYLSDFRKTPPEKLRTILREPVK